MELSLYNILMLAFWNFKNLSKEVPQMMDKVMKMKSQIYLIHRHSFLNLVVIGTEVSDEWPSKLKSLFTTL